MRPKRIFFKFGRTERSFYAVFNARLHCFAIQVVDYLTKVRKFHRPQEKYKCNQEVDKNSQEVRIISRVVNVLHYTFFKSICM